MTLVSWNRNLIHHIRHCCYHEDSDKDGEIRNHIFFYSFIKIGFPCKLIYLTLLSFFLLVLYTLTFYCIYICRIESIVSRMELSVDIFDSAMSQESAKLDQTLTLLSAAKQQQVLHLTAGFNVYFTHLY